ncbi:hypothetical protein B0T25DRAFT_325684 [Lasiosphaeria hispida]|uniref:Uncharacterized protein n=1 Tax=Lasiosphaeria hispida TaxID=260671 RepID=A0AAJ0MA05_9PEZI|nr:hypothetical protein B0T25DRAFT_325684 [Lasiosphaeria hispida]
MIPAPLKEAVLPAAPASSTSPRPGSSSSPGMDSAAAAQQQQYHHKAQQQQQQQHPADHQKPPQPSPAPPPPLPSQTLSRGSSTTATTIDTTAGAGAGLHDAISNFTLGAGLESSISGGAQPCLPALPAPGPSSSSSSDEPSGGAEEAKPTVVEVNGAAIMLDHLGPMVVGRDGTVSRIANWHDMTERERQTTLRVLGKRNQLRIASLLQDS